MMKKLTQFAFMAIAFSFLAMNADTAAAQKRGGLWAGNDKQSRKEYRREVREARKEYKRETKEARRDYKQYRKAQRRYDRNYDRRALDYDDARRYNRRGYGYYNIRPYRGARRAFIKGRLPRRTISRTVVVRNN